MRRWLILGILSASAFGSAHARFHKGQRLIFENVTRTVTNGKASYSCEIGDFGEDVSGATVIFCK